MTTILVNAVGQCLISRPKRNYTEVDPFLDPVQGQFTITGRPAQITDPGVEIDLLTRTNEYQRVSHVTVRLTRDRLAQKADLLRAWAEKIVPQLLAA